MVEFHASYYLYVAAFLFSTGLGVMLLKRNMIYVLIGIELLLNGANLVLATFSNLNGNQDGHIFAIFSVVITVCEVAIALAILLNVYRYYKTSDFDELTEIGNE